MRVATSNIVAGMMVASAMLAATSASAAVNITSGRTRNMQCDAGACVPTAKNSDLNVIDLAHLLKSSDVTVYTGNGAVTIEVTTPLTWTSSHRLTLNAYNSVAFKAQVISQGSGGMTIVTNVQGLGGEVRFFDGGSISFWDTNSSLVVDGVSYTLENSIPTLASAIAANPAGNYALANDYNAFVDGIYLHSPIPTVFSGRFEGLGHTIDNLKIQNTNMGAEYLGLFSETGTGSLIRDIHLTDLSIAITGAPTSSGLVGHNRGTVANASASGAIDGGLNQGGLVGENDGTITTSSAAVELSNANYTGGGLAASNLGTISFSHATGSVTAPTYAGGLTSYSQGPISDSYATGSVTIGEGSSIGGGLVGYNSNGSIARSFATGSVGGGVAAAGARKRVKAGPPKSVPLQLGGLVGNSNGQIADSYATGSVAGMISERGHNSAVGGLIGAEAGASTAVTSYSAGAVSLNRGYLGGFVGFDGTLEKSNDGAYWDLDTSGLTDQGQGAGNIAFDKGIHARTSDQFRHALPKGFSSTVWALNPGINNGFPYLLSNPPPQ